MNSQRIMSEGFFDKLLGNLSKTAREELSKEEARQKKARIKQLKSKMDKEADKMTKHYSEFQKQLKQIVPNYKIKKKRYTADDFLEN